MAGKSNPLVYENEDVERLPILEKQGYRTTPILYINGEKVPSKLASQARPNQTLLSFLRDTMGLTGSKLGCAEGGCGACTVMISKANKAVEGNIQHYSVNACLMPILAADGCHVTTVEGIGTVTNKNNTSSNNLHPVQQAMVDMHGSQCGFCTPGIIVSIYTLLANKPSVDYLEEHLDGNLCRCTGYRPIWDAARSLCEDGEEALVRGPCGIPCQECPERETCEQDCNVQDKKKEEQANDCCSSSSVDKMGTYKDSFLANRDEWGKQPSQMFPKELLDESSVESKELTKPLAIVDRSEFHAAGTWFKPTTLLQMLQLLTEGSGAKIVIGNTEVGIEARFQHKFYPRLISPAESIQELFSLKVEDDKQLFIGSCCPLSKIQNQCGTLAKQNPRLARTTQPIHDMLRWFASTQIRNVACLGGNLVTASPISDMNPLLACMGATLVLSSAAAEGNEPSISRRKVKVSDFFLKYRTVDLQLTELVERVEVPVLGKVFEYLKPFKQARRREDDISIVTSGMRIKLKVEGGKFVIDDIALAFGGMAITSKLAVKTAEFAIGAEFCEATFQKCRECLLEEFALPEAVPGGQAAFRMTLVASFLHKFYLSVVDELKVDVEKIKADPSLFSGELPPIPDVAASEATGAASFVGEKKPRFTGVQKYPAPKVASGLEDKELPAVNAPPPKAGQVGKPATHMSGPLHCTGEAVYTDDIPLPPGTLQATLILSDRCGVTFEGVDTSAALALPGVVAVYAYEDLIKLGGDNTLGPIVHDETVFLPVGERINTVGQVLGVVVGETLESADRGAQAIDVSYGPPNGKIIVTIEDAIEAGSFFEFSRHSMERGDSDLLEKLSSVEDTSGNENIGDIVKVSGTFRSGAQEHFYLEPGSTLVVPSESDTNLTIYASTQAQTKTQNYCASATGTPAAKVVVRMKRMGGGFGGKETRTVFAACAAAVAAKSSGRPVRLTLGRDVDMKITGTRHAFLATYDASAEITDEGARLVALDVKLYNNGGHAFDLTGPVLDRALFHVDGCYYFPNFRAEGVACKTVQPPHTAFRGFGGNQGMVVVEHVVDHLALACKVPAELLRRNNFYKIGQATPFGMVIGESGKWNVPAMWDRIAKEVNMPARRKDINEFNDKNLWLKRGQAIVPTKFGIAFTAKYMNQGGALVHLYTDGTVLISHGGTEMGQGLHTKVCQVAAQAFGIPLDQTYVAESSTNTVANTIPTAASMSTDMYGMATLNACRQILARLEPIREKLGPDASLKEVATAAHFERIDLSAHGFFALDGSRCGFDWLKDKPSDFPDDLPANSWKGHPFNYFTQGVAYAEVEVDLLTGNHRVLRSDVLVDVGSSINPAIDIGQIEGAFIQGLGWSTIEEVIYADDDHPWIRPRGVVFTTGPGTYKIPAFNDVPEVFNVSLLENVDNPFAVHSSKAVGEPPFFLGTVPFYAIKDALQAARKQNTGEDSYFEMRMPATSERIRMYAGDSIAADAVEKMKKEPTSVASFQPQGSF